MARLYNSLRFVNNHYSPKYCIRISFILLICHTLGGVFNILNGNLAFVFYKKIIDFLFKIINCFRIFHPFP